MACAQRPWMPGFHIPAYRPVGIPGIRPGTYCKDLSGMSEEYVRSRCPGLPNDPLHKALLAVAAGAVVALIEEYRRRRVA